LVAVAAFAVAGLAWLANEPGSEKPREPGSTFDTSPGGTSLAFAYLDRRGAGGRVRRLTRPLRRSEVEKDAVVFRIRPLHLASPILVEKGAKPRPARTRLLEAAEEAWVQAGGRLVIALAESRGPLSLDVD
jgi:hypothetical protein